MTSSLLKMSSFGQTTMRRVVVALVFWSICAFAVFSHGAWLGTGTIDLTPSSRTEIKARVQNGQPALSAGDIIEVYSSFPVIVAGTQDGPGGYATMYVPEGAEVAGAFITDAAGNPLPARPARATTGSGVSKGWGPKGQQIFDVTANGWQPSDTSACTLAGYTTEDCNAGLAYIYGDTGIFYSTRSDTALFANGSDIADLTNGYLVNPTNGTPWSSVGGSGTARVHNKWDAVQLNAFGSGGSIDANGFTAAEETSITGGRGATPFRAGSPVAGPDSGSDWDRYGTTGPWNRIRYPGSCRADDPALPGQEGPANGDGSVFPETTDPGVNSEEVCSDASTTGVDLNSTDLTSLPAGTNAVRFAFGGIAENEVFYAALRLRITDPDALKPVNAEGHGGDSAEGGSAGNDNPWRYWVAGSSSYAVPQGNDLAVGISIVELNGAPYGGGDIPPSATLRYRVTYANTSLSAMTNAVVDVTLPAQTIGTANFAVVSGDDIRPATDPSGGTFAFQTIPTLGGLESGAMEFDVITNAPSGSNVAASPSLLADEGGPVADTVSVNVFAQPVEAMPGCTGTRSSLIDWANDTPNNPSNVVNFDNIGVSGDIRPEKSGIAAHRAQIGNVSTLYAGTGDNPMLDFQYMSLDISLISPLSGIYFYAGDINGDESVTVIGFNGTTVVSPAVAQASGSFPMTLIANDGGSVTAERGGLLGSGASRAVTFGFHNPVDRIVITHGQLTQTADPSAATDGAHLTDIQTCLDYTDAPSVLGDVFHNVVEGDGILLGTLVSAETAPGNAVNADSDNDDGLNIPPMTQGLLTTITAEVNGAGGNLQGWIDFNGNDVFEPGTAEQIALNLSDDGTGSDDAAGDGFIQVDVAVPGDAVLDQTYARFRWATATNLTPTAPATDGEVEDFAVTIAAAPLVDRGDAPVSYGDPQHIIAETGVAGTYLGAVPPDPEALPQHSANATGDDLDGSDDEDGVALPQFFRGGTAEVTVIVNEVTGGVSGVTGAVAFLQAWIDFDADGAFDAGDMIASDLQDGSVGDKDGVLNGQIVFDVPVPATASLSPTFARFRWSSTSGVVAMAIDGEVEDYTLTISGDPPPVSCDAGLYQIATTNSTLKKLQFSLGPTGYTLNLQNIGSAGDNIDGGWGFSEVDGYLYAVRSGKRELWRVDGAGTFTRMPDPPGSVEKGSDAGDILPNGIMAYRAGNTEIQLLDIADPNNSVDLGLLTLDLPVDTIDFAYNAQDGSFYGIDGNTDQIFKVSANNGTAGAVAVSRFGPAIYTGSFGAVWFDQTGLFYAYDNISNDIFLIDTETGLRQFIATSQDEEGGTNDGASCRGPSAIPFGSLSGNVYIDENGSDAKDGAEINLGGGIAISVYDDRGTPNDPADDSFVRSVDTLPDGTFTVENLTPGATYRVELDEADTDLPVGSTIGTSNPITGVAVAPNQNTPSINFGFDPSEGDLSLTKVAYQTGTGTVVTSAAPGDVIDFIISVNNAGPGSPSGVAVIEKLPSGFEYISDNSVDIGDTFDPVTGRWDLDQVLAGATEELTVTVRVLATGNHVNEAEIIESSLPDVDSDPATGAKVDDLNDGLPDDDEDTYEITLETGGRDLSGRVIVDNGAGGGVAHDAVLNGSETGTDQVVVSILDDTGALLAQPKVSPDGNWTYALDAAYTGEITVSVERESWFPVSEAKPGTPLLVDADPRDGRFTFTPATDTDYPGLDFGVIEAPRLTQDQIAAVEPGQVTSLLHEYVATTSGSVSFVYADVRQTPVGGYSAGIYDDPDCDGQPNEPISATTAIDIGDRICLVSRVSAGAGLAPGSSLIYEIEARTTLSETSQVHVVANEDRITTGAGDGGQLVLSKTVRNETLDTAEGTANQGGAGDILFYRITLENPSQASATDVTLYDRTPAYTKLSEPIPSPVAVGGALSCSVAEPISNVAGYAGPLRWECAGAFPPASIGSVTFRVRIDP